VILPFGRRNSVDDLSDNPADASDSQRIRAALIALSLSLEPTSLAILQALRVVNNLWPLQLKTPYSTRHLQSTLFALTMIIRLLSQADLLPSVISAV
jgi:hypothetical protein